MEQKKGAKSAGAAEKMLLWSREVTHWKTYRQQADCVFTGQVSEGVGDVLASMPGLDVSEQNKCNRIKDHIIRGYSYYSYSSDTVPWQC